MSFISQQIDTFALELKTLNSHGKFKSSESGPCKGYPNKKVGKRYMTFNIEEEPSMVELIKNHNLVGKLIESYPEHVSGAPVFLEP